MCNNTITSNKTLLSREDRPENPKFKNYGTNS